MALAPPSGRNVPIDITRPAETDDNATVRTYVDGDRRVLGVGKELRKQQHLSAT